MTEFTSNIEALILKFKGVEAKLENVDYTQALVAGVNAGRAAMSNRIFNQGKDVGGSMIGSYGGKRKGRNVNKLFAKSKKKEFLIGKEEDGPQTEFTDYEVKRIKAGRQIRYKDLEFTGTLRRGIIVVTESPQRVVCAVPSPRNVDIIKYQEEAIQSEIFRLNDAEQALMNSNIMGILNQLYVRVLNS